MIPRHNQSLLDQLFEHDDFMLQLKNIADMGAGQGNEAYWWATQQTRDEDEPTDLNIRVHAVDAVALPGRQSHRNIDWQIQDYADTGLGERSLDLICAFDSLQCTANPLRALSHWHSLLRQDGMLAITLPYNHSIHTFRGETRIDSIVQPGCYYNHGPASLLLMLASAGFDCRYSHFNFYHGMDYMQAIVYRGEAEPQIRMDWYDLIDRKLLPVSVEKAIETTGVLRDSDIIVEWIDRNVHNLAI
jgi:SAM-dependent methyltransferase